MRKKISSLQNPSIKNLILLKEKSRQRKKSGTFIIEGLRELNLAMQAGYEIIQLWLCPEAGGSLDEIESDYNPDLLVYEVSKDVYAKIAHRNSTEGILAVARSKAHELFDLHLPENPLILIAEAPEKPGNIGALLRTADAAGVDAFILANPRTDLYNPNTIRSSVGAVFTVPIATATASESIHFLHENNINLYSAILQESVAYQEVDFTRSSAIAVGTEASGLDEIWRTNCKQNIRIPMQGKLDSMNVSVAAGILIFEARRQRGFKN